MSVPLVPVVPDTLRFVRGSLRGGLSGALKEEERMRAGLLACVADLIAEVEVEQGARGVGGATRFAFCC